MELKSNIRAKEKVAELAKAEGGGLAFEDDLLGAAEGSVSKHIAILKSESATPTAVRSGRAGATPAAIRWVCGV